jgi:hypothetical protein
VTTDVAAVTAQALSLPFFLALLAVGIVLLGALAYVVAARRGGAKAAPAPHGVERLGYGRERWERQLAMWQGVVRRLEIQARGQDPIPERLQREIAEAKAKVEEAQAKLGNGAS